MDPRTVLAEQLIPRIQNVSPGMDEEEIEEIHREDLRRANDFTSKGRSMRPPRRRIHGKSRGRDYQMFKITTTMEMDSRRSMDGSDISSSSNLTMATSATSTNTDPWSSSGYVEEGEDAADFNWDEEDNGPRMEEEDVVPKLEPIDDVDMAEFSPTSDVKGSVVPETPSSVSTPAQVKRPRGRPRKHPKPTPESMAKVAKGRSKTGCITCRKRKKKCDETKPGCTSIVPMSPSPLISIRLELRKELSYM